MSVPCKNSKALNLTPYPMTHTLPIKIQNPEEQTSYKPK